MAFAEELFPPKISFGALGGPQWVTNVVRVNSGAEYRNRTQSAPLSRWDVSHAARREEDWADVYAFFMTMGGRHTAFLYKDWSDYGTMTAQGVFTMITATTFQMAKRYTSGAQTFDRPIYKPLNGTIVVGGAITGGSINYATGVVTVATGTPTTWSGEFYLPARFDIDQFPTRLVSRKGDGSFIYSVDQIPIQETRDIA